MYADADTLAKMLAQQVMRGKDIGDSSMLKLMPNAVKSIKTGRNFLRYRGGRMSFMHQNPLAQIRA
ncbi:MAG: hypothetical protein U1E91_03080 [Moraxella sp.]